MVPSSRRWRSTATCSWSSSTGPPTGSGSRVRAPTSPARPRRDGTVVFDLRRDLYGRQTLLPTAVLPPAPRRWAGRHDGLARAAPGRGARRAPPPPGPPRRRRPRRAPPGPTSRRRRARRLRPGAAPRRRTPSTRGRPTRHSGTSRASPAGRRPTPRWPSSRSCAGAGPELRRGLGDPRPRPVDPGGRDAGRDRLPRVVRRAGHGPGPGHQHRARGVVPPAPRPARRPVLPRLPVEGDGRVAVASPRAAAEPGRR